jgi:hypothetical protein
MVMPILLIFLLAIGAQILPPPDAGAKNIPTLIEILKEWNTEEKI